MTKEIVATLRSVRMAYWLVLALPPFDPPLSPLFELDLFCCWLKMIAAAILAPITITTITPRMIIRRF